MDINCYAVEALTKLRLSELRAEAARYAALAAARESGPGVWATVKSTLLRTGRRVGLRGAVGPRHA